MNAASVGRNDPCPCGSGKKYKKCCLDKQQAVGKVPAAPMAPPPGMYEAPIDRLSNSVLDAIEAGRLDEAEKLCERLLKEFPDRIDGHNRLGKLREAQGRFQEALEQYDQVLAAIRRQPQAFDPESVKFFESKRQRVLAKLKS